MKSMLTIKFYCYNPTYKVKKVVSIAKSNVTATKVESLVNGFQAPDIARIVLHYNGHTMDVKTLNKAEFMAWWKERRLGL